MNTTKQPERNLWDARGWSSGEIVVLKVCDSKGPKIGSAQGVADYFQEHGEYDLGDQAAGFTLCREKAMSTDGKTQGKCPNCKVAFRFSCPARLKDARCPDCGTKLAATTYLYRGEWRDVIYCYPPWKPCPKFCLRQAGKP